MHATQERRNISADEIRYFYTEPSRMTDLGRRRDIGDELPDSVDELVRVVQGLVVYDVVAKDFYGFDPPKKRLGEIHRRPVEAILDDIFALDAHELTHERPVSHRTLGRCRHYVVLLLAMLRNKGIPARARCGFASYFNPGFFEDHWVVEYWNGEQQRWIFVDPQLDAVWRDRLHIDFDVLDVPRDRFLVAADAWHACRSGSADASTFGVSFVDVRGLWYVGGNLVRDLAALNKVEMLPWDVWGAQPGPDGPSAEQRDLSDQIAELTADPDQSFAELRDHYREDDRVRVPQEVFNALLNRSEPVAL